MHVTTTEELQTIARPTTSHVSLSLTPEGAADALGVSVATLSEWRKRGIGPTFVRLGAKHGRVLYKVADLEAFLDDNRVETNTRGRREPKAE